MKTMLAILALLAIGQPAHAQQCYIEGLGMLWHSQNATYLINSLMYTANANQTDWENGINYGADAWSQVQGSNFYFLEGGFTDSNYTGQRQHQNVIGWLVLSTAYRLGNTTLWYTVNSGILEVQTYFNQIDSIDWSGSPNYSQMDIQSVATHELGHWLFLDDEFSNYCTGNTMYWNTARGSTSQRYLSNDDKAGIQALYSGTPTAVKPNPKGLPTKFELGNFPNPFNPSTTVQFSLPQSSPITINVYYVLGRRVSDLVDGPMPAGTHQAVFTANSLPSGTYFVIMNAGNTILRQKILLMK